MVEIILKEKPIVCVPFQNSDEEKFNCRDKHYCYAEVEQKLLSAAKLRGFNGYVCLLGIRLFNILIQDNGKSESKGKGEGETVAEMFEKLCYHENCLGEPQYRGIEECVAILRGILCNYEDADSKRISVIEELGCRKALLKVCFNAFTITNDFLTDTGLGLYLRASAINHSCHPNAAQLFTEGVTITIRALRDIQENEEIFISYIETASPTWWRRSELMKNYNFICCCSRCTSFDEKEGFRCLQCSKNKNKSNSKIKKSNSNSNSN